MRETTLCLPCALARRPPVTPAPHGCPGQLRKVSGTGQVRVVLCECPVCWPGRSPDRAGQSLHHLGVRQQTEGGAGQSDLAVPDPGPDDHVRRAEHPRVDQDRP